MSWHESYKQVQDYLYYNNIIISYKDLKKLGVSDLIVPHLDKECNLKALKNYKKRHKGSTLMVAFVSTFVPYHTKKTYRALGRDDISTGLRGKYIDVGLFVLHKGERLSQAWFRPESTINDHALAIEKEDDLIRIFSVLASRIMAREMEE